MNPDPDRLLRRVWLINGFLVLAFLAVAACGALFAVATGMFSRVEEGVEVRPGATPAAARPRAVRFGAPAPVRGTSTTLSLIYHGEAEQVAEVPSVSGYGYAASRGGGQGALVNVVFVDSGKPAGRLLLDRPAYIGEIRYPDAGDRFNRDSLQTWISYQVALADTDRDGSLDDDDAMAVYVSALDGTGFRRVSPEGVDVTFHGMRADRRSIVIIGLQEPGGGRHVPREQLRQRVFVYDVPTGRLTGFSALEGPAARAARIVGQ
ncbi:MAG: hypothetical protein ACJ8J0_19230 [Longimicrobiaceae bacterium]